MLCLAFLVVTMAACRFFTRSWSGLSCFAVREDETAASSMGVSPVRAKLTAFVLGTALAGLSGVLYAHYMRFISADSFTFPFSVTLLSIVVAGGLGTFWGPLVKPSSWECCRRYSDPGQLSNVPLRHASPADDTIHARRHPRRFNGNVHKEPDVRKEGRREVPRLVRSSSR
ncbi:MAG: branched-chain amino acid ABC transporter permease [Cloacibacillus evryensis]